MPDFSVSFGPPSLRRLIQRRPQADTVAVRIIAGIVFLNGLFAVLEVIYTHFSIFLERILPVDYDLYGRYFGLFAGFLLIYFSSRLLLRKLIAWRVTLGALLVSLVGELLYVHSFIDLILPLVTLLLLLVYRDQFVARSEPETLRQGVMLLGASLLVALLYGTIGFARLPARDFGLDRHFTLGQSIERTLAEFTLVGNNDLHAHTRHARWFLDSLDWLGATSLAFAVYSLFRPLRYRYSVLPHERERAAALLERYGNSSEDAFKLWPEDKSYFFMTPGSAFLAYRVEAGSALVLGEPVGPLEQWPRLIADFSRYCREHDWLITFVYVPAARLPLFEDLGFRSLKIGEDAIVETKRFVDETARNKHFRAVRNKFTRLGYVFEVSAPPHSPAIMRQVAAVNRNWLSANHRRERGFALGYYDRGYLQRNALYLLYRPDGSLEAFASDLHSYDPAQATIDLMRYRVGGETGVMDFLFYSIIHYLAEAGTAEFSLGLAPLTGLASRSSRPIEERILSYAAALGVGGFSYEGLRRYKQKFDPRWEERFIAYSEGPVGFLRSGQALNRTLN